MMSLQEYREKADALKAEQESLAKKFFADQTKHIFNTYPALGSFSWAQYTPYFNDGDECVFSVYADEIDLNWDGRELGQVWTSGDELYVEEYEEDTKTFLDNNKQLLIAAHKNITSFLGQFDGPAMKEMFGDHVRVTVSATGVETEGYSHD